MLQKRDISSNKVGGCKKIGLVSFAKKVSRLAKKYVERVLQRRKNVHQIKCLGQDFELLNTQTNVSKPKVSIHNLLF